MYGNVIFILYKACLGRRERVKECPICLDGVEYPKNVGECPKCKTFKDENKISEYYGK